MALTRVKNPMVDVPSQTETVRSVTATDTCTTADQVLILSGASFIQNLYTAVGNAGRVLTIIHNGTHLSQVYTIDAFGSETISGSTTYPLYTNGEVVKMISDGSNWIVTDHYAETDWQSDGAITITATTTNPNKPSGIVVDRLMWRRNGKNLEGRLEYKQSNLTGATAGSGDYLFRIVPSALTVDTSSVTAQSTPVEGSGFWQGVTNTIGTCAVPGSTTDSLGVVVLYDSTRARFAMINSGGEGFISAAYGDIATTANHSFTAWFSVPITEFKA